MQIILPKPGTYVVAVSGGVDSMALLHVLHNQNNGQWKLIVAHLDHGIREDSHVDRKLVQQMARDYKLPFVYNTMELGANTSEDKARKARYAFLEKVQTTSNAQAIIMAHHRDDVLETAIHNIIRGSGRKGLTSLSSRAGIERPFLQIPKKIIIDHAELRDLTWREDATNNDTTYTRNYIRHNLLKKLTQQDKENFHDIIARQRDTNDELDTILSGLLIKHAPNNQLDRKWFVLLPHNIACEIMATWLRDNNVQFDVPTIERTTVTAKTGLATTQQQLSGNTTLHIYEDYLALTSHER